MIESVGIKMIHILKIRKNLIIEINILITKIFVLIIEDTDWKQKYAMTRNALSINFCKT